MLLKKMGLGSCYVIIVVGFCSCYREPKPPRPEPELQKVVVEVDALPVKGTVKETWTEEMHNKVRVPGQLDPTGVYYRPPHDELVEIIPGRTQPAEYPIGKDEGIKR